MSPRAALAPKLGRGSREPEPSRRSLRTPAVLAWLRLLRVWHKVTRIIAEDLRAAGMTTGQFGILLHVGAAEGITQQALANTLAVTQGNICQLVDKAETAGLIQRRALGRTNRLYLTPHGRALFSRMVPAHEALISAQFEGLLVAQQRQLHQLLRDLDRSIRGPGGDVATTQSSH